ncbi:eukaryotic translation initiation factor 3 subunit H-like [Lineus longissimus]|uniref:eukaryotic translation initiation factor 3 subunit H-like n=1 Tax=Lineus longissimus TaxID=88925 RepID=UPI002B4CE6C6
MASKAASRDNLIQYVQIDGLVALKIIKHCHEESAGGSDLVQGVLLGLVAETANDKILEITNCFPFPRHNEDEEFDEVQYQMEMMKNLRHVNIDHLHVGWYQSTNLGSFINRAFLESQFIYQHSIEESVVLIYDPNRTTKGQLSLKAFRLTQAMMELYESTDFSPESIKASKMSFNKMFQEIPVVLRNSHLCNVLLCDLEEMAPSAPQTTQFLDLATSSYLEKKTKLLMGCVDDLSQDCNKYFNFQRQAAKQNQAKQQYLMKRQAENQSRVGRGEQPLGDDDINKMFKPLVAPPRLDSLLTSSQIDRYTKQINEFSAQSFGKLFMSECLQEERNTPAQQ